MFAREHFQIEEKNGNLGDGQDSEIEKFVPVEQLGCVSEVIVAEKV
jgi:hypothetical protein